MREHDANYTSLVVLLALFNLSLQFMYRNLWYGFAYCQIPNSLHYRS